MSGMLKSGSFQRGSDPDRQEGTPLSIGCMNACSARYSSHLARGYAKVFHAKGGVARQDYVRAYYVCKGKSMVSELLHFVGLRGIAAKASGLPANISKPLPGRQPAKASGVNCDN